MAIASLRRSRAGIAAVLVLHLSSTTGHAQVETAVAVIGIVTTIAGMFGPKASSTAILTAIADNIGKINQSLQHVTQELDTLKKDVQALPDRILQNEMTVQITGRLQNTYQSLNILSNARIPATRESVYRDLRSYNEAAKNLRADIFSTEMRVAERLALQIPLLYGIEQASFNALNSIDLEDPANKANYVYYVHEDQWRYALVQYAQFYRLSLDESRPGSFANRLKNTEIAISDIFATLNEDYKRRLQETDDVILTTSFCYYSATERRIATGRECDDTGCSTNYEMLRTYSFAKRTYVFEKDEKGEVSQVKQWNVPLADFDGDNAMSRFQSEFGNECEKLVPENALKASEALTSDDIKKLELLFLDRNFLRALQKLGETMQEKLLTEMKLRNMIKGPQAQTNSLKYKPQFIGSTELK